MEISPLDHFILRNGHKTVNVERLPSSLDQTKLDPPLTIPDLQREIGRLRQEIAFHQDAHVSLMKLFSDTREAYRLLQGGLRSAQLQDELSKAFILISSAAQRVNAMIKSSLVYASERLAAGEEQFLKSYNIALDDMDQNDCEII